VVSKSGKGITRQRKMTTDNAIQSIREWVLLKQPLFPILAGLEVLVNGDNATASPPLIGITESGDVETWEQNGVTMHGVLSIPLSVVLETVPDEESDEETCGTTKEDHRAMASALYDILANRDAIQFCQTRNGVNILDIRNVNPTTSAQDGRRVTTFQMNVVACPNY
jgi:hypothetical protein